ncbi:hypothetical protein [Dyadobacter psychrophilus]|uniref:Uncharacterized protein n=1 Tax=Dyadobacter psychrophilus TaxID=651661 RepID=A0A1T5DTN6_9BACT|nr:hypothetical protein [Dyadobacter psychrophilus]SKB75147.1 hypothetical protein SAMN05660293_01906 [Dyadobacter psychrophilus]
MKNQTTASATFLIGKFKFLYADVLITLNVFLASSLGKINTLKGHQYLERGRKGSKPANRPNNQEVEAPFRERVNTGIDGINQSTISG